jgi:hypothetical protein
MAEMYLFFQRGLRPGSPTPATRCQPHRLPGHTRDLRACASTAQPPQATPPQSMKARRRVKISYRLAEIGIRHLTGSRLCG